MSWKSFARCQSCSLPGGAVPGCRADPVPWRRKWSCLPWGCRTLWVVWLFWGTKWNSPRQAAGHLSAAWSQAAQAHAWYAYDSLCISLLRNESYGLRLSVQNIHLPISPHSKASSSKMDKIKQEIWFKLIQKTPENERSSEFFSFKFWRMCNDLA